MPPRSSFITLVFVPSWAIHPGSGDLIISWKYKFTPWSDLILPRSSSIYLCVAAVNGDTVWVQCEVGWRANVINLCWNYQTIEEQAKCLVGTFQVEVYGCQENIISCTRVHIQRADLPQTEMTKHVSSLKQSMNVKDVLCTIYRRACILFVHSFTLHRNTASRSKIMLMWTPRVVMYLSTAAVQRAVKELTSA